MKRIYVSKNFTKRYAKGIQPFPNLSKKVEHRIQLFLNDKLNPILKDHALVGKLKGYRSFALGGDLRIIYVEFEEYYLFTDIGSHNQVY